MFSHPKITHYLAKKNKNKIMSQQHQQKCASLYYKSEDLKKVLHSQSKNILKESSSWLRLNEFVEINKKLVLIDLDYAIEKKSEVDLWNVAFKGQLISKCPFGIFKSSKKPKKNFPGFLP